MAFPGCPRAGAEYHAIAPPAAPLGQADRCRRSFGLLLPPGADTTFRFSITVPTMIEKTIYFGNSFLMQLNYNDVGQYLDRGVFPFAVT